MPCSECLLPPAPPPDPLLPPGPLSPAAWWQEDVWLLLGPGCPLATRILVRGKHWILLGLIICLLPKWALGSDAMKITNTSAPTERLRATLESQHWNQQAEVPENGVISVGSCLVPEYLSFLTSVASHNVSLFLHTWTFSNRWMPAGAFLPLWIFGSLFQTPTFMSLGALGSPHNFCYLIFGLMLMKSFWSGRKCSLIVKHKFSPFTHFCI